MPDQPRESKSFARGFLLRGGNGSGGEASGAPRRSREQWVMKREGTPESDDSSTSTPPHSPDTGSAEPSQPQEQDDWLVGLPNIPNKKKSGASDKNATPSASARTSPAAAVPASAAASRTSRKRAKRKAAAARVVSLAVAASATTGRETAALGEPRGVRFDSVTVVEVPRDVGGCGVPSEGTWALSLAYGSACPRDKLAEMRLSVDAHEEVRQNDLSARLSELPRRERPRVASELETRQWDFKSGQTNPLFGRLSEKARKELLLRSADDAAAAAAPTAADTSSFVGGTALSRSRHGSGSGQSRHPQQQQQQQHQKPSSSSRSSRSGHHHQHNSHSHHGHQQQQEMAASHGAGLGAALAAADDGAGAGLTRHDLFMERAEAQLAELEAVRGSRLSTGGCSCRAVSARQVDKVPLPRLREELKSRGLSSNGPRKDLQKALLASLEATGGAICNRKSCECFRSGVGCHGDVCRCCGTASPAATAGSGSNGGGGACRNPEGLYRYESSKVDAIRRAYITARPAPVRNTAPRA